MGTTRSTLDDATAQFILAQRMFFVATAPLDPNGHVNLSPKGLDTLRVLGPRTIAYVDLTGSGIETVSHLKENGRIVLMFCSFQEPPMILRLHGLGRVGEPEQTGFLELASNFSEHAGTRAIVLIEVNRISDSCGFGVPLLKYEGER